MSKARANRIQQDWTLFGLVLILRAHHYHFSFSGSTVMSGGVVQHPSIELAAIVGVDLISASRPKGKSFTSRSFTWLAILLGYTSPGLIYYYLLSGTMRDVLPFLFASNLGATSYLAIAAVSLANLIFVRFIRPYEWALLAVRRRWEK